MLSTVKKLNVFIRVACGYGLKIVSGDKKVKDVANFFILNPLETVMTFPSAKTGATIVEYNECLEIISIVSVSTAECERGFGALSDVSTKERNRLWQKHSAFPDAYFYLILQKIFCLFYYHHSIPSRNRHKKAHKIKS